MENAFIEVRNTRNQYHARLTIVADDGTELQRIANHDQVLDGRDKGSKNMCFQDLTCFLDEHDGRAQTLYENMIPGMI